MEDDLTVKEREILLAAEQSSSRESMLSMLLYGAGIAFCAFYFLQSIAEFFAGGRSSTFEVFSSTFIAICFAGLLYEHTKFQRQAFSLIRKLAEKGA